MALSHYGVEIDVRTFGNRLVVSHDPFQDTITFAELLNYYHHDGIIINVKEEGLESRIVGELLSRKISNFLFLDQSFPFMIRSLRQGLAAHVACRVSDLESEMTLMNLNPTPAYVWCDSFTGEWGYLSELLLKLVELPTTPIIVSPELHGRDGFEEVEQVKALLLRYPKTASVCTKLPRLWS